MYYYRLVLLMLCLDASAFQTRKDNFVSAMISYSFNNFIYSLVVAVVMSSCILCSTSAVAVVEAVTFISYSNCSLVILMTNP